MPTENPIVRVFRVDRARTPQAALDATGRKQYVDGNIVATMPTKGPVEGEMEFFRPHASSYMNDDYVSDEVIVREYEALELDSDPLALAAVNESDSAFADKYQNCACWPLEGGGYGFLMFDNWDGEHNVRCGRISVLARDWLYGGVRK